MTGHYIVIVWFSLHSNHTGLRPRAKRAVYRSIASIHQTPVRMATINGPNKLNDNRLDICIANYKFTQIATIKINKNNVRIPLIEKLNILSSTKKYYDRIFSMSQQKNNFTIYIGMIVGMYIANRNKTRPKNK